MHDRFVGWCFTGQVVSCTKYTSMVATLLLLSWTNLIFLFRVFTNPTPNTIVGKRDGLYVLVKPALSSNAFRTIYE